MSCLSRRDIYENRIYLKKCAFLVCDRYANIQALIAWRRPGAEPPTFNTFGVNCWCVEKVTLVYFAKYSGENQEKKLKKKNKTSWKYRGMFLSKCNSVRTNVKLLPNKSC